MTWYALVLLIYMGGCGWCVEPHDCVLLAMDGTSTCAGDVVVEAMVLEDRCDWKAVLDFTFSPPPLAIYMYSQ